MTGPRVVIALICVLLFRGGWPMEGKLELLLGAGTVLIALGPTLRRWARPRGHLFSQPMPIFALLGVLHAIYFGVPMLVGNHPGTPSVIQAGTLACFGWGAFLLGARWRVLGRFRRPLSLGFATDRAQRQAAFALYGLGLLFRLALGGTGPASSLGQLSVLLPELERVGLGLLALLSFRGQLPRGQRALVWWGLVPLHFVVQLVTGSVANLAWFGLFLCLLAWARGRRVPVMLLLCSALVLGALRGVAGIFRSTVLRGQELSMTEKAAAFGGLMTQWSEGGSEQREQTLELMRKRTDHLELLALIVEKTPRDVPYWNGETYRHFPASFVPRLLWPGKPAKRLGQDFGHRYGILAESDEETSINLPMIVEMYANFGLLGAFFGMHALGGLFALLGSGLNRPGMGDGGILVGAYILSRLMNVESDFSLVFGAVPYNALFLFVVLRVSGARSGRGVP